MIGSNAFQSADGDRLFIDSPAPACRFTGTIANTTENSREHVRFAVFNVGVAETSLGDQSYI
jgi:hypothetical protein